ncbi:MAG: hypothetical protein AB7T06_07345 [Kofleriaceae bacterium]
MRADSSMLRIIAVLVILASRSSAVAQHASGGDGITSETMHHFYGGGILVVSSTLLVEEAGAFDAPRLRYLVPGATIVAGGALMLDPLLHGSSAPTNYGAETWQHLLVGGMLLAVGTVDLAHEARWLEHWTWGLMLPAGLLATGASFLVHSQHGEPSQHTLLRAQHRILGATIAVAAITKGLTAVPDPDDASQTRWPELESAWMVAAGLAGLQLLLYTEGDSVPTDTKHRHAIRVGVVGNGLGVAGTF